MIKWAKAKICVYADSALCVVKIKQNPGAADAKWTGQIEDLKRNPSYQDAVCLDGAIFATLTILTKIHTDMERKEHRTGELQRLDYVTSVFNDISWKKNDENCILNAEKELLKEASTRTLDFSGFIFGKRWYGGSYDGQWDRTVNKMVQQLKESCHPIFTATSALTRGTLKQRKGKCTIHFNGDFRNTEPILQTINSVNQVSIYAAVTNWSYKFALQKAEKTHSHTPSTDAGWSIGKEGSHDLNVWKKLYSNISSQLVNSSEFDQLERRRRMVRNHTSMQRTHLFSSLLPSQTVSQQAQLQDRSKEEEGSASHKRRKEHSITQKSKEEEAAPLKGGRDRRGDGAPPLHFSSCPCASIFLIFCCALIHTS